MAVVGRAVIIRRPRSGRRLRLIRSCRLMEVLSSTAIVLRYNAAMLAILCFFRSLPS